MFFQTPIWPSSGLTRCRLCDKTVTRPRSPLTWDRQLQLLRVFGDSACQALHRGARLLGDSGLSVTMQSRTAHGAAVGGLAACAARLLLFDLWLRPQELAGYTGGDVNFIKEDFELQLNKQLLFDSVSIWAEVAPSCPSCSARRLALPRPRAEGSRAGVAVPLTRAPQGDWFAHVSPGRLGLPLGRDAGPHWRQAVKHRRQVSGVRGPGQGTRSPAALLGWLLSGVSETFRRANISSFTLVFMFQ